MPAIPFAEFARSVLALYAPPLRAKLTCSKMRQVLGILAGIPGVETTADLTTAAVAGFIASRGPDANPNTTIGLLGYVRAACSLAVNEGWLERSPFRRGRKWLRRRPSRRVTHHGRDAIARLLEDLASRSGDWAGGRLHALAAVVALTGLRRNEALLLKVEDIDLGLRVIYVEPRRSAPLKTEAAAAPVPIPACLVPVLAGWIPRAGSEWVFPGATRAKPWTGGSKGYKPLDRLKASGEAVGIEGLTFQSLRHSWATHAESAWNLSEPVIQRVLRHTTPFTQKHYRHADLVNLAGAVCDIGYRTSA